MEQLRRRCLAIDNLPSGAPSRAGAPKRRNHRNQAPRIRTVSLLRDREIQTSPLAVPEELTLLKEFLSSATQ